MRADQFYQKYLCCLLCFNYTNRKGGAVFHPFNCLLCTIPSQLLHSFFFLSSVFPLAECPLYWFNFINMRTQCLCKKVLFVYTVIHSCGTDLTISTQYLNSRPIYTEFHSMTNCDAFKPIVYLN